MTPGVWGGDHNSHAPPRETGAREEEEEKEEEKEEEEEEGEGTAES